MLLGYATNTLIEAKQQAEQSRKAATLVLASRSLLRAILPLRVERGSSLALGSEDPADPETLAIVTKNRQAMIDGFQASQSLLRDQDVPTVTATLDRLSAAHEALKALRPRIDAALRLTKAQRDATLMPAALAAFQALLDALAATTDAVDHAIPHADAILQRYLVLKRSAWETRIASGNVALRVQASLADGTFWSLPETVAAAEERARLRTAWANTTEAAADASETVRAAFQKASASNFEGAPAALARTVFDALSQQKAPGVTFKEMRQRNTVEQRTIVDLAYASLEEMVHRAEELAHQASNTLARNAATLLAAIVLVALGLFALFGGVLRPIRTMAATMRVLAEGDTSVEVPIRDYRNEFRPMAAAVQVFKDNLIRSRQLEDEAAQARLAVEEQRRAGMRRMAEGFEAAVGGIIGSVSASATELQATAQTMTATATQTASQSTTVAAAAEEAASNV
ncbi:HAMP domain-containing protein, partial [Methylobacterium sp. NEAU K]|uniref:HAMP domain-containing protein n=1 Tax=Methylobacterium sp. NEAU K TaxID=3064946 RepID=UPI00351F713B